MDTSFSYAVRVTACDRCGGPCEATVAGGGFTCRYCRAFNQLDVRDEALVAPARIAIPEHERITRLRMQDGKPLLPPPSIAHLVPGGALAEWKVDEAVAVWNQTRQELRQTPGSYEAAERLIFLAMVLAQHFHLRGDKLRQRALLEGALDASSIPRHRQIMRGFLARAAVRCGDLQAAEAWLKPCDPLADDLQMDSAYRLSRAFLDTAYGNFPRVIEVLGRTESDVPIEDASDDICAVLRANAWEKLGQPDHAVMLLRERFRRGGGSGRQTVERVIQVYADWQLCALSYPRASAGHAAVASKHAARAASGGIHLAFVPLGALMLLAGLGCAVAIVAGLIDIIDLDGAYLGLLITASTCIFMGAIFLPIGLVMKRRADQAAWLRQHGIQAQGQIDAVTGTGVAINDVPMMRFTITVRIPGRAPYTAATTALGMVAKQGSVVPLRVHPTNPAQILLELD